MTQPLLMPRPVIVDTAAAFALISASDRFHEDARRAFNTLLNDHAQLFITNYILVEFLGYPQIRLRPCEKLC